MSISAFVEFCTSFANLRSSVKLAAYTKGLGTNLYFGTAKLVFYSCVILSLTSGTNLVCFRVKMPNNLEREVEVSFEVFLGGCLSFKFSH